MKMHTQSSLFVQESSTGALELFPDVWGAAERLVSPDALARHNALDRLLELQAPRLSPLIAYLLVSRLTDPDVEFRARVLAALSDLLSPDEEGKAAPGEVRDCVLYSLSQMRQRAIYAILQVSLAHPELEDRAAILYDHCPYAGNHLAAILADSMAPPALRQMAVLFIGRVGYLDAIPGLERILIRLESRQNGQKRMPFAPSFDESEAALLPVVKDTLLLLKSS